MAWDSSKPAGTDAANTLDTTVGGNFVALDTWASAITDGVSAGAAVIYKMYRSANATIAKFRAAAGDTVDRFSYDLNGKISWGSGSAAQDVTLERVAANLLSTGTGDAIADALDRVTSIVDVTNTVTETTLYSFTILGNTLGTNRMLRLTIIGDMLQNTSGTVTIRFKFGGVTVGARGYSITPSSSSRGAVRLGFELYEAGTNTQRHFMQIWTHSAESVGTNALMQLANIAAMPYAGIYTDTTHDQTTNAALVITAQWDTASPSLSYRLLNAILEVV